MALERTRSCLPQRAASCLPQRAASCYDAYCVSSVVPRHVEEDDDDCVSSVVPRHAEEDDDDCVSSVVPRHAEEDGEEDEEEDEEEDGEEDGEVLLQPGDTVSPKRRGAAAHQISRTKSGGGAAHQNSRSKSGGSAAPKASKKYVPCGVEKNPNLGSPRSPTFGADLLQAPFQKLASKRLEELFRVKNREKKQANQAGLACQNGSDEEEEEDM